MLAVVAACVWLVQVTLAQTIVYVSEYLALPEDATNRFVGNMTGALITSLASPTMANG